MKQKQKEMDSFIRNANVFPRAFETKARTMAAKVFLSGRCPCEFCPDYKPDCVRISCYPWFKWFQMKWRKFRTAAGFENEEIPEVNCRRCGCYLDLSEDICPVCGEKREEKKDGN